MRTLLIACVILAALAIGVIAGNKFGSNEKQPPSLGKDHAESLTLKMSDGLKYEHEIGSSDDEVVGEESSMTLALIYKLSANLEMKLLYTLALQMNELEESHGPIGGEDMHPIIYRRIQRIVVDGVPQYTFPNLPKVN